MAINIGIKLKIRKSGENRKYHPAKNIGEAK